MLFLKDVFKSMCLPEGSSGSSTGELTLLKLILTQYLNSMKGGKTCKPIEDQGKELLSLNKANKMPSVVVIYP